MSHLRQMSVFGTMLHVGIEVTVHRRDGQQVTTFSGEEPGWQVVIQGGLADADAFVDEWRRP